MSAFTDKLDEARNRDTKIKIKKMNDGNETKVWDIGNANGMEIEEEVFVTNKQLEKIEDLQRNNNPFGFIKVGNKVRIKEF